MALLIIVPVVTGILAIAILSSVSERRWEADAAVSLTGAIASESVTQQALGPQVDDFVFALSSRSVAADVAEQLGVPVGDVAGLLQASRSGSGAAVTVSFAAESEQLAVEGLEVGTRTALSLLAANEVNGASAALRSNERQVAAALARLDELEAEAGTRDVSSQFQTLSADIQELRNSIASASVAEPALAAALQEVSDEKQAELDRYGSVLTEWERASSRLQQASEASDAAERRVFLAEELIEQAGAGDILRSPSASRESLTSKIALPVVAAVVGAQSVVLGAAVLSGRQGRINRRTEEEGDPMDADPRGAQIPADGVPTGATRTTVAADRVVDEPPRVPANRA